LPTLQELHEKMTYIERAKEVFKDITNEENTFCIEESEKCIKMLTDYFSSYSITQDVLWRQQNSSIFSFDHSEIKEQVEGLLGTVQLSKLRKEYNKLNREEKEGKDYKSNYEKMCSFCEEFGGLVTKEIIKNYKSQWASILTYADEDGQFYSDLEHSGCVETIGENVFVRSNH